MEALGASWEQPFGGGEVFCLRKDRQINPEIFKTGIRNGNGGESVHRCPTVYFVPSVVLGPGDTRTCPHVASVRVAPYWVIRLMQQRA